MISSSIFFIVLLLSHLIFVWQDLYEMHGNWEILNPSLVSAPHLPFGLEQDIHNFIYQLLKVSWGLIRHMFINNGFYMQCYMAYSWHNAKLWEQQQCSSFDTSKKSWGPLQCGFWDSWWSRCLPNKFFPWKLALGWIWGFAYAAFTHKLPSPVPFLRGSFHMRKRRDKKLQKFISFLSL